MRRRQLGLRQGGEALLVDADPRREEWIRRLLEMNGLAGQWHFRTGAVAQGSGNSTFVESKLTNWTYSNSRTRQTINVGVAYGTPLRKAADTIVGVLGRHGLVLKDPAPQVYLENYGDSAIGFDAPVVPDVMLICAIAFSIS
jgi:hypothetical protein